jgi:non-ribosomal peptide synthetase component F
MSGAHRSIAALLYRRSGQEDLVVGADVANRNASELEGLVGFFVNMLVLRIDASGSPRFSELVRRVRETALGGYDHQDLPFDTLVEAVRPRRGQGHSPLFRAVFVYDNAPPARLELAGVEAEPLPAGDEDVRFDLSLFVEDAGESIRGSLRYRRDLFEPATVEALANELVALVTDAVGSPDTRLDLLRLATADGARARGTEMDAWAKENLDLLLTTDLKPVRASAPDGRQTSEDA